MAIDPRYGIDLSRYTSGAKTPAQLAAQIAINRARAAALARGDRAEAERLKQQGIAYAQAANVIAEQKKNPVTMYAIGAAALLAAVFFLRGRR